MSYLLLCLCGTTLTDTLPLDYIRLAEDIWFYTGLSLEQPVSLMAVRKLKSWTVLCIWVSLICCDSLSPAEMFKASSKWAIWEDLACLQSRILSLYLSSCLIARDIILVKPLLCAWAFWACSWYSRPMQDNCLPLECTGSSKSLGGSHGDAKTSYGHSYVFLPLFPQAALSSVAFHQWVTPTPKKHLDQEVTEGKKGLPVL